MKILTVIFLLVVIVVLGIQINSFLEKNDNAQASLIEAKTDLERVRGELDRVSTDLNFFLKPENLEKELRARFNFKTPEENLIIVVPGNTNE